MNNIKFICFITFFIALGIDKYHVKSGFSYLSSAGTWKQC